MSFFIFPASSLTPTALDADAPLLVSAAPMEATAAAAAPFSSLFEFRRARDAAAAAFTAGEPVLIEPEEGERC